MVRRRGLLATGAVLGLTDVDALTISMARSAATGISPQTAARAIAIGIVANSVMKATIAGVLGTRAFAARTGGVLAVMAMVLVVSLVLLREERFHVRCGLAANLHLSAGGQHHEGHEGCASCRSDHRSLNTADLKVGSYTHLRQGCCGW